MGQFKHGVMFRQVAALGAKSDVYSCLIVSNDLPGFIKKVPRLVPGTVSG